MLVLGAIFGVFLLLLALGMSVPFAILVPAMFYLFVQGGFEAFNALGLISWANLDSFTLTAVPLFVLMAEFLQTSGLTVRAYRGLAKITAPIPGGLLQTNIAGCALFAAVSGSSIVTAASLGSVALPQLVERGYSRPLAAGSLAAGGTLGILIPPSIVMIIYSQFTDTSVAKLFMAGVVPGIALTLMFMLYIAVHAKVNPAIIGRTERIHSARGLVDALVDVMPLVAIVFATLGVIYFGIVTPTEAAAMGCVFALVAGKLWGSLKLSDMVMAGGRAITISGNILFIVFAAYVFSHAMSLAGVGEKITSFMIGMNLSRVEFLIALIILYTVLGCLVESVGMIVVTVPLLFPLLAQYQIDPIWFGIAVVIFVELGQISPPIGINLFVIQSIWKGTLGEVVLGTIPFHIIMVVLLVALMIWPGIALWLPSRM